MSEHRLQVAAVNWFRYQYPNFKKFLIAIPNGGKRSIGVAKKLKDEGVLAGALDLFLSIPRLGYHGLYIETKFGKNKLTDNQKEFQKAVESQGYKTAVYYDIDEFINIIKNYFNEY